MVLSLAEEATETVPPAAPGPVVPPGQDDTYNGFLSGLGLSRNEAAVAVNAAGALGIVAWGTIFWDYFQNSPKANNERWFERDTREGGADKLGHAWVAYASSHLFAGFYENAGYDAADSILYGTMSSYGLVTLMELGDSFSNYGFAWEDMVANTVGAAAGYVLGRYPEIGRKLDFRVEYRPSTDGDFKADIVTDYERLKYLLAVKAEGFDFVEFDPLRYLEIHLGFFARNYDDFHPGDPDFREQSVYIGFGINVGRVLRPLWDTRLFNYFQVPYTYRANEKRID